MIRNKIITKNNNLNYVSKNHFYIIDKILTEKLIKLRLVSIDKEWPLNLITKSKDIRNKCNNKWALKGYHTITFNGKEFEELKTLKKESKEIDLEIIKFTDNLEGKILIQAGHYIPDINDLSKIQKQPLDAFKYAIKLGNKFIEEGKKADLLLFINDLHLGKGKVGDENRKLFYENFALPNEIRNIMLTNKHKFNLIVVGEKQLSNKLIKDIQNIFLKSKKVFIEKIGKYKLYKFNKETIGIIKPKNLKKEDEIKDIEDNSSHIRCSAACIRVSYLAEEMGYKSYIQIFPTCAYSEVEFGCKISKNLYRRKINILNIYKTMTCWGNCEMDKIINEIGYLKPIN